jgi:hypothetical protein
MVVGDEVGLVLRPRGGGGEQEHGGKKGKQAADHDGTSALVVLKMKFNFNSTY